MPIGGSAGVEYWNTAREDTPAPGTPMEAECNLVIANVVRGEGVMTVEGFLRNNNLAKEAGDLEDGQVVRHDCVRPDCQCWLNLSGGPTEVIVEIVDPHFCARALATKLHPADPQLLKSA